MIRHSVSALTVYYNNLPPKEGVRCYISPIKALPERKARLVNPTVNVNGGKIVFPVVLESGQYIDLSPNAGYTMSAEGIQGKLCLRERCPRCFQGSIE